MKPSIAPSFGDTIEKTTRTRVIPADANDGKTPECWDYLAAVEQKGEWANHIVYIHRTEPSPTIPVQKCAQYLITPNGQRFPVWDREEIEFALLNHFGGGRFRFLVKRGPMIITKGEIFVDAAPRIIQAPPAPQGETLPPQPHLVMPSSGDGTVQIANKAIDTVAGAEHQAVSLGLGMMSTAANLVKQFASQPGAPASSESDQMFRMLQLKMMEKLIEKMDAPQTPTIIPGLSGEVIGRFLMGVFERGMNPAPASAPASGFGEIVRIAPSLIQGFAEVMREQRMAIEAQNSLRPPTINGTPMQPNPQLIPPATPASAQPPPPPGAPSVEFVERKIVEIFSEPTLSAAQAAENVVGFLDTLDPKSIGQLAALGETGLVQMFASRPILKTATANMPRLIEFIRAFLRIHAEDVAHAQAESAAEVQKPPLPN